MDQDSRATGEGVVAQVGTEEDSMRDFDLVPPVRARGPRFKSAVSEFDLPEDSDVTLAEVNDFLKKLASYSASKMSVVLAGLEHARECEGVDLFSPLRAYAAAVAAATFAGQPVPDPPSNLRGLGDVQAVAPVVSEAYSLSRQGIRLFEDMPSDEGESEQDSDATIVAGEEVGTPRRGADVPSTRISPVSSSSLRSFAHRSTSPLSALSPMPGTSGVLVGTTTPYGGGAYADADSLPCPAILFGVHGARTAANDGCAFFSPGPDDPLYCLVCGWSHFPRLPDGRVDLVEYVAGMKAHLLKVHRIVPVECRHWDGIRMQRCGKFFRNGELSFRHYMKSHNDQDEMLAVRGDSLVTPQRRRPRPSVGTATPTQRVALGQFASAAASHYPHGGSVYAEVSEELGGGVQCSICNAVFRDPPPGDRGAAIERLLLHVNDDHPDESVYPCGQEVVCDDVPWGQCYRVFRTRQLLDDHFSRDHEEPGGYRAGADYGWGPAGPPVTTSGGALATVTMSPASRDVTMTDPADSDSSFVSGGLRFEIKKEVKGENVSDSEVSEVPVTSGVGTTVVTTAITAKPPVPPKPVRVGAVGATIAAQCTVAAPPSPGGVVTAPQPGFGRGSVTRLAASLAGRGVGTSTFGGAPVFGGRMAARLPMTGQQVLPAPGVPVRALPPAADRAVPPRVIRPVVSRSGWTPGVPTGFLGARLASDPLTGVPPGGGAVGGSGVGAGAGGGGGGGGGGGDQGGVDVVVRVNTARGVLYRCRLCPSYSTFSKQTASNHRQTHEDNVCSLCGNRFSRRDTLKRHMKNVHCK